MSALGDTNPRPPGQHRGVFHTEATVLTAEAVYDEKYYRQRHHVHQTIFRALPAEAEPSL